MPPKKSNGPGGGRSITTYDHKLICAVLVNISISEIDLPRIIKFMGETSESTTAARIEDLYNRIWHDAHNFAKEEDITIDKVFRNPTVTLPPLPTPAPVSKPNPRKRTRADQNSGNDNCVANSRPNPGPFSPLSGRGSEPRPSPQQCQHNHQQQNVQQIPVSTRTPSASNIRGDQKLSAPVGKQGHKTLPPPYTAHSTNVAPESIASALIPNSNNVVNQTANMGMGMGMGMGSLPSAQMLEAQGLRNGYGHGLHNGGPLFGTGQVGNGPTFKASADQKSLTGPNKVEHGVRPFKNNGTIQPGTNGPSMRRHPSRGNMGNQTGFNGGAMDFTFTSPNDLAYNPFMGNVAFQGNTLGLEGSYLDQDAYMTNDLNHISDYAFNTSFENLATHMQNASLFPPENPMGNHRARSKSNMVAQNVPRQMPTLAPTPQTNMVQQQQKQLQNQQGRPQPNQLHPAWVSDAQVQMTGIRQIQLQQAQTDPALIQQWHLKQFLLLQARIHQSQLQQGQVQQQHVQQELVQQPLAQQQQIQQGHIQQGHVQQELVQQQQVQQGHVQQEQVPQELNQQELVSDGLTLEQQEQMLAQLEFLNQDPSFI